MSEDNDGKSLTGIDNIKPAIANYDTHISSHADQPQHDSLSQDGIMVEPTLTASNLAGLKALPPFNPKPPNSLISKKSSLDQFLKQIYRNKSGFTITYSKEDKDEAAKEKIYLTYGELLTPSVDYLLEIIRLTSEDRFLDLGSGLGRLCLHVYMRSKASKVYGIESYEPRHLDAINASKRAKRKKPELFKNSRELILMQDNFLNFDFSLATVVFMCSTCYSAELMHEIGDKINATPSIRCAISMKKIPNIERLKLSKETTVRTSWSDASPCHIYT